MQPVPDPSGSQGSALRAVSCASAGSCTAVGYKFGTLSIFRTLAEVWNGTAWILRFTPNRPNVGQNELNGVSCVSSQLCIAVGLTELVGQIPATLVEAGH
jgi:hypothetical protein